MQSVELQKCEFHKALGLERVFLFVHACVCWSLLRIC